MGKASREKGKRGEREVAAFLREYGYDGKRGVQYHGGTESPDVSGLPGVHIEVKRTERFDLYGAMAQAKADSGPGELPLVVHRKNKCEWVAVMTLADFMSVYKELEAYRNGKGRPKPGD